MSVHEAMTRSRIDVVELDMDIRSPESDPIDPRVRRVDCYSLDQLDLGTAAGLLIGPQIDQEFLLAHRRLVQEYLDSGGIVVFGGHLHRSWLPGAAPFVPLAGRRRRDFRVGEVADHPLFAGLSQADLTFRRGVAGFFARGHHPPPPEAEILVWLSGGQPCTYLDRTSTAGVMLVHATADLRGFVGSRLVDWVLAESARTAGGRGAQMRSTATGQGRSSPRRPAPAHRVPAGLAAVYGGSSAHHRALTQAKYAQHLTAGLIYLPDLPVVDLGAVHGLVLPERMHRGLLTAGADQVLGVLARGGLVAAFAGGECVPEFLPGVRWEYRPTNFWWWLDAQTPLDLQSPNPGHPLFEHLSLRDCTWHHHGILDPPPGADVLVTLPSGEALLYVDRVSTPGTLVVSTLDPLSHYGGYFMPATERFLDGFLPWLCAMAAAPQATPIAQ